MMKQNYCLQSGLLHPVMYMKANGIVLYLQVHNAFCRRGFGTYLLYLVGMTIAHRTGKDHAAGICLLANEKDNKISMSFFTKLGFKKFVDPSQVEKPIPKPVALIKKCTSVFNTIFTQEKDDGMVRLSIEDTGTLQNSITWQMSLMNPNIVVDKDTGKAAVCDNVY
jgi:hypothetical protein